MLPVSPTGRGNSPYMSPSAFAGNELLIGLEPGENSEDVTDRVNYPAATRCKLARLRLAFNAFQKTASRDREFEAFRHEQRWWLEDYALFRALRDAHRGDPWTDWAPDLRVRRPKALAAARQELAAAVLFYEFLQYEFHRHWTALRDYCHQRGIGLIGDIPIFVAHDSADVWAHPDIFAIDKAGNPTAVAGVPPDYFAKNGQLWGNPLYRWDVLRNCGYTWWIERLRITFERFDAVRLDHFIGFQRYWAVPAGARTAKEGRYFPGPGAQFFDAVFKKLGPLELIAEDLGVVTPEVEALRDQLGLPGMRVLQFAFSGGEGSGHHLPHTYAQRSVVYTGTHDNDTTVGWFNDSGSKSSTRSCEAIRQEREFTLRYLGTDGREIHWDMIRTALRSVANTAIFPLQDVLGLGSEARMNTPGTGKGNWAWRCPEGLLNSRVRDRLALMTETYARKPEAQSQTA